MDSSHTKTPQTRLSHGALSSRRHRRVAIFQTLWRLKGLPTPPTVEILSTAIPVGEHPSEGIVTAHLRPFVPASSSGNHSCTGFESCWGRATRIASLLSS